MYKHTYDPTTGGILLSISYSNQTVSKEPRPVYAAELDLIGLNQYVKYNAQNDVPYMWADGSSYYYRGVKVAHLSGGTFNECPKLIIDDLSEVGSRLQKIDIESMIRKNQSILSILESEAVKSINEAYGKYRNKLGFFHVAFSGGKDSVVVLDLVKKALPSTSFVVSFADTGMEFPDTYSLIEKTKEECLQAGIAFETSKSKFNALDAWEMLGPPSQHLRWCCSVMKSTPQLLMLRKLTRKDNYQGLAFVGIRATESSARSQYERESYSTKQIGQRSHNPILYWTSAEVWLYMYANNLAINEAYKKGCARVGCICCPMGSGKDYYIKQSIYPETIKPFTDIITRSEGREDLSGETFLSGGGWNSRRNGNFLKDNEGLFSESSQNGTLIIKSKRFLTPWQEWIKPLGDTVYEGKQCITYFKGTRYVFTLEIDEDGNNSIEYVEQNTQESREFSKLLRQVFRKATYCIGCQTCEADCRYGSLKFSDGVLKITDCKHCLGCFDVSSGCLAYETLKKPLKEKKMEDAINTFGEHGPKPEWFTEFFNNTDFLEGNSLGPTQFSKFKRLLKDAELIQKAAKTPLVELLKSSAIRWDSSTSFGIILTNLAINNPQMRWYIRNFPVNRVFSHKEFEQLLADSGQTTKSIGSIIKAFRRIADSQFGTELRFCTFSQEGKSYYYTRTESVVTDYRVILYALYKYAEANGNYKEFNLTALMEDNENTEGISPTLIFGISREEMTRILKGLSAKYENFIYASFTHDMEKIQLREDKTSADVLGLF